MRTQSGERRRKAQSATKAYGGTCPTCCGDLDDVAVPGTGGVVCLFCDYGHERSNGWGLGVLVPELYEREVPPEFDVSRRRVAMEKSQ